MASRERSFWYLVPLDQTLFESADHSRSCTRCSPLSNPTRCSPTSLAPLHSFIFQRIPNETGFFSFFFFPFFPPRLTHTRSECSRNFRAVRLVSGPVEPAHCEFSSRNLCSSLAHERSFSSDF